MSESEGTPTPVAEGQAELNQLLERVNTLEASKERILEESKGFKAKFQEATGKLESITNKQLEDAGNFEQLLGDERKTSAQLRTDLASSKKNILMGNIRSALTTKAGNVYDVEDLLRSPEAKGISYDEDTMELDHESIDMVVATLREKKPYLFNGRKIASQAAGSPANGIDTAPQPKSMSKLSNEELDALILKSN